MFYIIFKVTRKIGKIENLRNFLVVCFCESQCNIVFPENIEIPCYNSTRDSTDIKNVEGFHSVYKYS